MNAPPPSGTESAGTGIAPPERPADERATATPRPETRIPTASEPTTDGGLFRKRRDAIGPAPVYFEVLLGLLFGVSFGLMLGHPFIVAVIGALLGLLYALFRRNQPRR